MDIKPISEADHKKVMINLISRTFGYSETLVRIYLKKSNRIDVDKISILDIAFENDNVNGLIEDLNNLNRYLKIKKLQK